MPTGKITPISNLVGKIDKGAGTNDHNKLINRDLADQHPMEAIIGLLDALNQIDSKILTLDEKIDSEADFVDSELNKLRTELNTYKEFVNFEFIKTNEKIENTKEDLEAEITNLQDQINRVETHLNEVEIRFAEQIELLNTNLESTKQELNARIDEEATKAETALNEEVSRAITKETEIIGALAEEATARAEADILLKESLTNEIERATEAEDTIQEQIDNLSIEELSKRTYTEDKYILAHEYNKDVIYYEKVLDVNPDILRGMWKLKDTLDIDSMPRYTSAVFLNMYYYFYNDNGVEIRDPNYKSTYYGPGSRLCLDWNDQHEYTALGIGSKAGGFLQSNFYYKENSHWTQNYFKLIYIERGDNGIIPWLAENAEKLSDTLLPYNNYNYKTKYVEIQITEDDFESDKYYYLENTEHTIVRIQLDEKESIYRDYHGNDVLKIIDNNVLINGDPLYPNLTVTSDTYIDKVLENNAEEVYDNKLNRLELTIPNTAKHGFCSYISFEPNLSFTFNVINNSIYSLKIIVNGAKTTLSDLVFSEGCQYNLMFLCNGVNVELYIQEIQLG